LLALLERLRGTGEARGDAGWKRRSGGGLDRGRGLAERGARARIERNRDGGQLAGVVDSERTYRLRERRNGTQWNERMCRRRPNVQHAECSEILLELRLQLHDHVVFVVRRVDVRHLPGAVRVIERGFNVLRGDSERGRVIAIYVHIHLRIRDLQIARYILQLWKTAHARFHSYRGRIECGDVRTLH